MRVSVGGYDYEVETGEQNFYKIVDYAAGKRPFIVTDKNVARYYFPLLSACFGYTPDHIILPHGEGTKSWKYVSEILSSLIEKKHGKDSVLIALGGGVVGDITGFAASLYMRGIDYLQVPTTLLAAVDSSTGGKTGINFEGLKNYIGAYKQPVGVVINTDVFSTLPYREIVSGAGEVVKTALLDAELFEYFEQNQEAVMRLSPPHIAAVIDMCVRLKSAVVAKDERETGIRKILNAGHTVGHALESADGFRRSHGEYVLSGIFYEANIADRIGIIDKEYKNKIQGLVKSVTPDILPIANKQRVLQAMMRDKKNTNSGITFVLPVSMGRVQEVRLSQDIWAGL